MSHYQYWISFSSSKNLLLSQAKILNHQRLPNGCKITNTTSTESVYRKPTFSEVYLLHFEKFLQSANRFGIIRHNQVGVNYTPNYFCYRKFPEEMTACTLNNFCYRKFLEEMAAWKYFTKLLQITVSKNSSKTYTPTPKLMIKNWIVIS